MATRRAKKPEPPPLFDFPCTTTWYSIEEDKDKIPAHVWCLVDTLDVEGEESIYICRYDKKLGVWLTSSNTAIEVHEVVRAYSPVFGRTGELWKCE